jgi:hypothetical protein
VKLYGSILDSSVWSEPLATRVVWIAMLAMADANGCVSASVNGLARRAQVSREDVETALATFLAPDPDDRSGVEEGRRICVIRGGWQIINHSYYRELRTEKQVQNADRQRRFKERHGVTGNAGNAGVTQVTPDQIRSDQIRSRRRERGR